MEIFDGHIEKMLQDVIKAGEKVLYNEYREKGKITEFILVAHPRLRGNLENALYALGVKRIPIVYTENAEKDSLYAITDKTAIRNMMEMATGQVKHKCAECKYYKPYVLNGREVRRGDCELHKRQAYHDASQKACKKFEERDEQVSNN